MSLSPRAGRGYFGTVWTPFYEIERELWLDRADEDSVPKQEHKRIDLAVEQLDVALDLFLSCRSFVSALTLAGAAEEILGKALDQSGRKSTLQNEFTSIEPVKKLLRRRPYEWKDFLDEKNRVRNAAKHMRDSSLAGVVADIEDDALWMLVRACDNYSRLDLEPSVRMHQFDEWFHRNVIGIENGL